MYLREKAYCFALKEEACGRYCSGCAKSNTESHLSRCSSCKLIYYCSVACQKNDWYLHRVECKFIKRSGELYDDSFRLVLRMHVKSQFEHEEPAPMTAGSSRTFKDLISHSVVTEALEYELWRNCFRKFATNSGIDDERLKELYGKMSTNAFGLTNKGIAKIGLALHIRLSAINHSCRPKTQIAYIGDEAIMVPTTELPEGVELTIDEAQHSYINDLLPREERRNLLKLKYNFDCYCDGCVDEQRNKQMSGYCCERCTGCVGIGEACYSCSFLMSHERSQLCELNDKVVEASIKSLKNSPNSSSTTQLEICKKILDLMEGVYYKYNVRFFIVLRVAMGSSLSLKRIDEAAEYGERLLKIQSYYQYPNDFSLLHMKFNVAKLFMLQKNIAKAKECLKPVYRVFQKVYGNESLMVMAIRKLLLMNN